MVIDLKMALIVEEQPRHRAIGDNLPSIGQPLPIAGNRRQALAVAFRQAGHQLDFTTPGNLPCDAKLRKQIRQIPNFLKYPLGRPQTGHLL
jgi:hypothetical protein